MATELSPASRLSLPGTGYVARSDDHWALLDLIRFSGALLVLFGHARGLLLEGIDSVEHPNTLIRAIYFASGLQHEGVVMFFVVSGFLVGGSAWRMIGEGRFLFERYFINRFVRIYLVYAPALLFVALVTLIGNEFFLDTRFYGVRPLFPSAIVDGWTWDQIPCHLVALQGMLCAPWGADPPLWSLGYEWAFYLIAPPIMFAVLVPKRRHARDLILLAGALGFLTWWNSEWLVWFAMWILGACAARVFEKKPQAVAIGLLGLAACGAGLVLSRLKVMPPYATDIMVSLGIAVAISSASLMKFGRNTLIRRGAGFSYSLYLIHLPLALLVGATYERWLHWPAQLVQPDGRGLAGFFGMILIAIAVAWLFARLTEDHTANVRKWLTRRWLGTT
ncbi:MAG: acyltransferase family protein [Xanthobacteraceae bacterium]